MPWVHRTGTSNPGKVVAGREQGSVFLEKMMAKLGPKGSVGVSRKGNLKPRVLHVSSARSGWSVESAVGYMGYWGKPEVAPREEGREQNRIFF